MDRVKFRREFIEELAFFSKIANRLVKEGYTKEQVDERLILYSTSFYGALLDFDKYATKKSYFIATYPRLIYNGELDDKLLEELCDEIEEEERIIRDHKL